MTIARSSPVSALPGSATTSTRFTQPSELARSVAFCRSGFSFDPANFQSADSVSRVTLQRCFPSFDDEIDFGQRLPDGEHCAGFTAYGDITARRIGLAARKRSDRRALHDFLS